ncbi:MAG: site-specific integrase [Polyangia bacterium]
MGEVIKRQKDGRFIGWYIRYYDGEGKRRIRASGKPSYAEARRLLLQVEAGVVRGQPPEPSASRLTVAELCERFLASAHPLAKCPAQYRRQARAALRWILPLLGHVLLPKLRRRDIEQARDTLSQRYRPNTVRAALRPLGAALTWAVQQELLAQSPMLKLAMPRREHSTERLGAEDAARLLKEARRQAAGSRLAHSLFIGVSLAVRLGLRRGEVFGLRWQDVDVDGQRLTVARSFGGLPKNGRPRTLPIPPVLAAELAEWKALCPKSPADHVCPVGNRARDGLGKLLRAAGCPPLSRGWHALRHTFASVFLEQGGSILALKELLGHSALDMSLVYSHLAPGALARDIAKLRLTSEE